MYKRPKSPEKNVFSWENNALLDSRPLGELFEEIKRLALYSRSRTNHLYFEIRTNILILNRLTAIPDIQEARE
jgi:hypothetical protein